MYAFPPSRNSTASCSPVDAPEGTAALPKIPFSVTHLLLQLGFLLNQKFDVRECIIISYFFYFSYSLMFQFTKTVFTYLISS